MRGDAVQLHQEYPDFAGASGDLVGDAQGLFHGQNPGNLLEERCYVVHAGTVGHALVIGAELHGLLDTGVQVPGAQTHILYGFAVQFGHHAQHAVGRRVNRSDVYGDAVIVLGFDIRCHRRPFAGVYRILRHIGVEIRRPGGGMNILDFRIHCRAQL